MFRRMAMIRFWVVDSKKSIILSTEPMAPLVRIAWGFSIDIFSNALMQASFKSIKPILCSRTVAKHFTPPCVTMLLQIFGNMSIRFVIHCVANTIRTHLVNKSSLLLISFEKSESGGLFRISKRVVMY